MTEKTSPIHAAQEARKKITQAVERRISLQLSLTSQAGACLLGLPAELLQRYGLNALIKTGKTGVQILVADSENLALQAFRNWQKDNNPEAQQKFNQTAYLALYRLIQAIKTNQAESLIKEGIEGLILAVLEEEDKRLEGLSQLIKKRGAVADEDLISLHLILHQIWQNLPEGIRSSMASFNPKNVF
jgi:aspartyl aminopeptidase